ncbi:MAG: GSCFA domain-containing protein [Saprospiraceae bacterium]
MNNSFRTVLPEFEFNFNIGMDDAVFCMGSCFAEAMSSRLQASGHQVFNSPFGIVFNPLSMASQIRRIVDNHEFIASELIQDQGLYHSLDHHGSYSGLDAQVMVNGLNTQLKTAWHFLQTAERMILTFGSSHYYTHNATRKIVANCHKLPAGHFEKRMASTEEMALGLEDVIGMLLSQKPSLQIIISVSPVRYLRDGFIENNRSKAALIQLCSSLCRSFNQIHYFPAYEIFMDDLRDYRFCTGDHVHLSEQAEDYIGSYCSKALFDAPTRVIHHLVQDIRKMMGHRSLHAESTAAKHTEKLLSVKIQEFREEYPHIADRLFKKQ